MNAATTPMIRTVDLGRAQLLVIDAARAQRVRVLAGAAWLTQEGDSADAVLCAGAERRLCGGRMLIEALEPARLQIVHESGFGSRLAAGCSVLLAPLRRWTRRLQWGPALPEAAAV